jgi:hypothetical protein
MGWKVNADPPGPSSFAAATQFVTPAQVAAGLSCGPNVETHVQKIKTLLDAGFTGVALLQIGGGHARGVHRLGARRTAARVASRVRSL